MNYLALLAFLPCALMVKPGREVLLFVLVSIAVFTPLEPSIAPDQWYWMLFCIDAAVGLFASIINAPGSRDVFIVSGLLCMSHMAGATVIPVGITPDPYTIMVQMLEALQIIACINKKGVSWCGNQLRQRGLL
jgi:hypothetical protein